MPPLGVPVGMAVRPSRPASSGACAYIISVKGPGAVFSVRYNDRALRPSGRSIGSLVPFYSIYNRLALAP